MGSSEQQELTDLLPDLTVGDSTSQVAWMRSVAALIGLPFDGEEAAEVALRLDSPPSVAVLGVVKRGKSRLVNELVGCDVCPVSQLGETAATIRISTGEALAWAEDDSGSPVAISAEAVGFSQRVRRSAVPMVVNAEFRGRLRLPEGVTLVDTPGIDDAMSYSDRFDYLDRHWRQSGSCGAVAVISLPPGLSRTDADLIAEAKALFRSNLVVVVKAVDSTVENSALEEVAAEVQRHLGVRPVVIPNDDEVGPWGRGKTAELDRAVSQLLAKGEAIRAEDEAVLDDTASILADLVRSIPHSRAAALDQLFRRLMPSERVHPNRPKRLELVSDSIRWRWKEFLEVQASEVSGYLPKGLKSLAYAPHFPLIRQLVDLAGKGSDKALDVLAEVLHQKPAARTRLGLTIGELSASLDFNQLLIVLRRGTLSPDELNAVIRCIKSQSNLSDLVSQTNVPEQIAAMPLKSVLALIDELRTALPPMLLKPAQHVLAPAIGGSAVSAVQKLGDVGARTDSIASGERFCADLTSLRGTLAKLAEEGWLGAEQVRISEELRLAEAAFMTSLLALIQQVESKATKIARYEDVSKVWRDLTRLQALPHQLDGYMWIGEGAEAFSTRLRSAIAAVLQAVVDVLRVAEVHTTNNCAWLEEDPEAVRGYHHRLVNNRRFAGWLQGIGVRDPVIDAFLPGGDIDRWRRHVEAEKTSAVAVSGRWATVRRMLRWLSAILFVISGAYAYALSAGVNSAGDGAQLHESLPSLGAFVALAVWVVARKRAPTDWRKRFTMPVYVRADQDPMQ